MTIPRADCRVILAGVRTGMSGAAVGRMVGLSRERVRQVWMRETEQPLPSQKSVIDQETRRIRRFWALVRVDESGCWIWTGGTSRISGYGHSSHRPGKGSQYAHRNSYEFVRGPIPAGLTIDHLCRVRACVNPDHLEAVTSRENVLRSPIAPAAVNAAKTHCKHGHAFTPENTRIQTQPSGYPGRACRTCGRERMRARTARLRAARLVAA